VLVNVTVLVPLIGGVFENTADTEPDSVWYSTATDSKLFARGTPPLVGIEMLKLAVVLADEETEDAV
jgi:hypothetical protein